MGWSNQAVQLILLSEDTSGFSGLFGYSPSPGAGNLIFSIAPLAGTDPYGNAYFSGISSINTTTGQVTQIVSDTINLYYDSTGSGQPSSIFSRNPGVTSSAGGVLQLSSGVTAQNGDAGATAILVSGAVFLGEPSLTLEGTVLSFLPFTPAFTSASFGALWVNAAGALMYVSPAGNVTQVVAGP